MKPDLEELSKAIVYFFCVIKKMYDEVGEALGAQCENIQFKYLPTVMAGAAPRYAYQLKDGITNVRQGMMTIENEGILEIIEGRAE